jgi:hypothetical protein
LGLHGDSSSDFDTLITLELQFNGIEMEALSMAELQLSGEEVNDLPILGL